jgi:glycosyltransferase involved in cell wall biosynthesis
MKKILMVGPCYKTKGGISAVINAYQDSSIWNDFNIKWIETYYDKSNFMKIRYFFYGLFTFLYHLPGSDILHIHVSEPISALRKLIFFIFGKLFFKPIIIHLHSFDSKTSIGSKFRRLYSFLFSKSNKVIVLSPYWANEVKRNIPNCQVEIIFNPCPKINKRDNKKEKVILFAGTLNKRKGYSVLIESFALIAEKFPYWRLIFAGNGEVVQAKEHAKQLGINEQVDFLGWISGEEKNKIFSKSMIFCLPSFAEGFPMAILDAFSYGIPVLSTKCGRIDMVLKDNNNILFFEMGNVIELSNKLDNLMYNEELRNKIGSNGYHFSQKNFELEVVVDKIKRIYINI